MTSARHRPGTRRWTSPAIVVATVALATVCSVTAPSWSSAVPSPREPHPSAAPTPSPNPLPDPIPDLNPVPVGPSASAVPTVTAPSGPAVVTAVVAPRADRVDRQWPRHPPWDACPRPVWTGQPSAGLPGAGRRVLIIGDSLTRESRVLSARGMRGSGWTPTFRCWGSKRLDWGIDQVTRSRQLGQLPGHVIVALGTNDISWETQQTTEHRVRALLARLGPHRQVIWVDLHLTRSPWLDARADWFNAMVRRLASTHPNLTVLDWHRVAQAHGIRGWDGIHYGPSGYRLRAATVLRALNAVGRAHPAPVADASPLPIPRPIPGPTASPAASVSPIGP